MNETESPPQSAALSNVQVAERIGLTHTGVSRIRTGGRFPSPSVMLRISTEFGWSFLEQATLQAKGDRAAYARLFRVKVMGEAEDAQTEQD